MSTIFDVQSLFWCLAGTVGSSMVSLYISWKFSGRYCLVANIVTVPSHISKYSKNVKIAKKKGFGAYDTYVALENRGNQSLQMSDFAPLNMPHIQIETAKGTLQKREKPYYVLPNPNPFAMYNNVQLSYDGNRTIGITFDLLKPHHTIEIVVHSLIPLNVRSRNKLAVGATLINGKFIMKKQLIAMYGLIQMLITAALLPVILMLPMVPESAKYYVPLVMGIWWPLSVFLVDVISIFSSRRKIVCRQ